MLHPQLNGKARLRPRVSGTAIIYPGRTMESRQESPSAHGAVLVALVLATAWASQTPLGQAAQPASDTAGAEGEPLLRSIDSLSAPLVSGDMRPVVLRGVVTLLRNKVLYVQDQTGALAVYPLEPARLAIGDEVELQGTYRPTYPSGALERATVRRLWSGSAPVPLSLKPEQAAEGTYRNRLIDTEGRLLKKVVLEGSLRLTLDGDRQLFGATLELSSPVNDSGELTRKLEEGSNLRLTGVCVPISSPDESVVGAFLVLLRSTDDVRVLNPPTWWSSKHVAWLGFGVVVLLFLLHRTRVRSLNQRHQAVVEERLRIAREMHDTLAQGFAGLTYQLEGLARELQAVPGRASLQQQLGLALQLVRHSREESHRSIFALRSLTQPSPDLLQLLVASSDSSFTGRDIKLAAFQKGKPLPLADDVLNNLLRIGQEAITNALRHSGADEIAVTLHYGASYVTLEVRDNGRGFEVNSAPSVEAGHFGLTGMRERAKPIHASFEIVSGIGKGTTVTVRSATTKRPDWRRRFSRGWAEESRGLQWRIGRSPNNV